MTKPKAKQNRLVFSDEEIQTEIWQGIRMHQELGLFDLDSLSVLVKDGVVLFTGHVSNEYHRELIKNIAYALAAINAVHCALIVDPDLSIEVDRIFSTDERTRPFIFPVGCSHAGVGVGGTESL